MALLDPNEALEIGKKAAFMQGTENSQRRKSEAVH